MSSLRSSSLTFKQLDALFWVVKLKGFQPAADRLHTSQSAISKRIKDLELLFDAPVFERSGHSVKLTDKGKELFAVAEELLTVRDRALKSLESGATFHRRLKLGCTEFTATIWLADLLVALGRTFPHLLVEPEVDVSSRVVQRLNDGDIDLAIVPQVVVDASMSQLSLGVIQHSWVCRTGLFDARQPVSPDRLRDQTLLMQRYEQSSAVRTYVHWLRSRDAELGKMVHCTNLQGLIGMTRAGMGIGYLPIECVKAQLLAGELCLVTLTEPPPVTVLVAAHEPCGSGDFIRSVAAAAQACCPLPPP